MLVATENTPVHAVQLCCDFSLEFFEMIRWMLWKRFPQKQNLRFSIDLDVDSVESSGFHGILCVLRQERRINSLQIRLATGIQSIWFSSSDANSPVDSNWRIHRLHLSIRVRASPPCRGYVEAPVLELREMRTNSSLPLLYACKQKTGVKLWQLYSNTWNNLIVYKKDASLV